MEKKQIDFPSDDDFRWLLGFLHQHRVHIPGGMPDSVRKSIKSDLEKFNALKEQIDNYLVTIGLHFTDDANKIVIAATFTKSLLTSLVEQATRRKLSWKYWMLSSSWRKKSAKFWLFKKMRGAMLNQPAAEMFWGPTTIHMKLDPNPHIKVNYCWMWKGQLPKQGKVYKRCYGCEFVLFYKLGLPIIELAEWLGISKSSVSEHHNDCEESIINERIQKHQRGEPSQP